MSNESSALRRLAEPLLELAQDCGPALLAAVFPELAAIASPLTTASRSSAS